VREQNVSVVRPGHQQRTHGRRAGPFVLRPPFARRPAVGDAAVARAALAIEEARPGSRIIAREGLHRRALIAADVAAAGLSLLALLWLADAGPSVAVFVLLPVLVAVNKAAGLYDRDEVVLHKTTLDDAPALAQISGLFALVVWLGHGALIGVELSPSQVLFLWVATLGLVLVGRATARIASQRYATGERCLVVGTADSVASVTAKLAASGVKAVVVATIELRPGGPTLDLKRFAALVAHERVDRVLVAPLVDDPAQLVDLVRVAKAIGVRVSLLPRLFEVIGSAVEFDDLRGLPILGVRPARLARSSQRLKRIFDVIGATLAVVVTAPLMIAVAIAIRLDSAGPILFRQARVGRDGRPFRILKFRSMVRDAEALKPGVAHLNTGAGLFKIRDDPRVTRVGRFIRRWRLDELPQLINVCRGDMSLVGPRPLIADEDARITGLDRSRLQLTPGMTGHWQLLGSTRVPMHEMVAIDYLYVANWSLWTDIKVLLRTVRLVVFSAGV
jgi:exopolysaccharide biosynthesis polyprenyl glycosylphosphotransferase